MYDDLSPKEKNAFLFYKNIGDSFTYLKNDTDTVTFTIKDKEINYYKRKGLLSPSYYMQNIYVLLNSNTDTNSIIINYFNNNNNEGYFYSYRDTYCDNYFNGCGLCNTKIYVNKIEREIDDTIINNFTYKKVYYLICNDGNYTTKTKALSNYDFGIIKFWNDTIKYVLLK